MGFVTACVTGDKTQADAYLGDANVQVLSTEIQTVI